ncbi:MAG: hypothetical protein ACOYU5_02290 [Stygiobacter sp.]
MRKYLLISLLVITVQIFSQQCTGNPVLRLTPADIIIQEYSAFSFSENKDIFSDPNGNPLSYKLWYWNNVSSAWMQTYPSWMEMTENDTAFLFSETIPSLCEETKDTFQFRAYNVCGDSSVVSFHIGVDYSFGPQDKQMVVGTVGLHMHQNVIHKIPIADYSDEITGYPLEYAVHLAYNDPKRLFASDSSGCHYKCNYNYNTISLLKQTRIENDTPILADYQSGKFSDLWLRFSVYTNCMDSALNSSYNSYVYYHKFCNHEEQIQVRIEDYKPSVNRHNDDVYKEPSDSFLVQIYHDTFTDDNEDNDDGQTNLSYNCNLDGGDPLPSWMQYDSVTLRITVRVSASSCTASYVIDFGTRDTSGNYAEDSFFFCVSEKSSENFDKDTKRKIALENKPWAFTVPNDAARSPLGETIYYSDAEETGMGVLPYWMYYDENTRILLGNAPSYAENYSISVFARHDCSTSWELYFEVHCQKENLVFSQGTGTEADPYQITTADDLDHVRASNLKTGKYFKLMNDDELTSMWWIPLREPNYPFRNDFDGNNKKNYRLNNG